VDALRERIELKGLELQIELDDRIEVLGIEEDLALMVRNLLENSLVYTAEGSISVSMSDTGESFELKVADTGSGIPTSDLERIFERFYRVDKARSRDTGGTGLGLAIVRHVAESHGGVVEVASELGTGSTFTVRLPVPARA
jgi:two-component system, OmpR family, sensor histidine kinase SenX3